MSHANHSKNFSRDIDGSWTCVTGGELDTAHGRIPLTSGSRFTRGNYFRGVDVAQLLDEEVLRVLEEQHKKRGI